MTDREGEAFDAALHNAVHQGEEGLWKTTGSHFGDFKEGFRAGWNAALVSQGWQPIETAPRDGTWILVRQSDVLEPSVAVCAFDPECSEGGWWMCCDGKNPEIPLRGPSPTHWMPLPALPPT